MQYKPHDYQQYAINYILEHPIAAVILGMGLGKTSITLTAIEQALERFGGTGTRVYAVIRAAQQDAEQARGTAVRLHKACERHDQLWCGAWAAPSNMHSDLAAAMPPTSTPTAWFAPSQPCPRRSGEAF